MRLLALLTALLLLAGCASESAPPPAAGPPAAEDPRAATPPEVDLSDADDAVRNRIESRRQALEAARAAGAPDAELAEAWGALGRSYLAQSFDQAAAETLGRAAALAPQQAEWPYLQGHALRRDSRAEEARRAFARAAELEPGNVPSLVWRAEMEAALEDRSAASATITRVLELAPDNAMALFRAGQLAADEEDYERAAELLGRVIELQPDADRVRHPYALALRELGRLDEAQEQLGLAGDRKPAQPDPRLGRVQAETTGFEVLLSQGGLAFDRGDVAEAIGLFQRAVELEPENARARSNLGAALLVSGRPGLARREFERAVEIEPDNAEARFNLGTFFGSYEEDEPAILHLTRAVEIEPEMDRARFNLANALRRTGRCGEAVPHYEQLLQRDASNRDARLARADCLVATLRWEEALTALQEAERVAPGDAALLALHARLLACCPEDSIRDGLKAVLLAEQAVRLEPHPNHGRILALAHFEAGNTEKALEWARGARDAAVRAGAAKLEMSLEQTLTQLENGYPCRQP